MPENDILKQISSLSVKVASTFKGEYPDELLQAFTLVGKYLTISGLDKSVRENIESVTNPNDCPLCIIYRNGYCEGCILKDPDEAICGRQYNAIKSAIKDGTYTDVAFNVSRMVRTILKRLEDKQ